MYRYFLIIFLSIILCAPAAYALAGQLIVTPRTIMQGEPILVTVEGIDIRDIKKLSWDGSSIPVFLYENKPIALIGIDLAARAGKHALKLTTVGGDKMETAVMVKSRPKITAPLGIPEKLGGNTKQSQENLVATLSKENGVLAKIKATSTPLIGASFLFPLVNAVVTDSYGYSRKTGSYSIPHKGVDFRAKMGTKITAINSGLVRLAREFTVYGKTVVIDHGGEVLSFSMHLSKISVKEGQKIKQGDVIGFSGDTGYATEPHLHLSLRIRGISIDPIKFFELFKSY